MSSIFQKIKQTFIPTAASEYCLALDVGTELVKALLFKNEAGQGRILGVGRFRQRLQDMQSGTVTDIQGVVENCQEAIEQAMEQAGVEADQVIIGIAGELVKGATTIVEYERPKADEKLSMKELEDIVQKVQWKASEDVRRILAQETGYQEIEVKLVNAAVVDVQIDGYKINNPIGFQGRKVSIGIYNSFAPLVHLGALQTIAEELDLDLLGIATEPYAVAVSVGNDEAGEFSAIFIDVGGGTSDVALVRNGGVAGTKMFALGGRAFTKRIASHLNIGFDKAEQMKLDYSNQQLDSATAQLIRNILEPDAQVWLSGIELILDELAQSEHLPPRILLCGGGSALPEIKHALETYNWQKTLPFARDPQVNFIKPADVLNMKDETGLMISPQDITPMALGNLALDLMGEERIVDSLLRKVARVMQQ
ncbi:MAG TPA: cell division FtsA domain-containing protein [bacterium]|nr:cell division FtsA domain-containing protein [bacterium]